MMSLSMRARSSTCTSRTETPSSCRVKISHVKCLPNNGTSNPIGCGSWRPLQTASRRPNARTAAMAADKAQSTASAAPEAQELYALVANTEFWFNDTQNESIAEQLRERARLLKERKQDINFWLVPDPTWLDSKYPELGKQVQRPCVALVCSDRKWMVFMKVRLDRVLRIDLGSMPKEEALHSSRKVPEAFRPHAKWTAPYLPYAKGWWEVFLPETSQQMTHGAN